MHYASHHNYQPNHMSMDNEPNIISTIPPALLWDTTTQHDDDKIMMDNTSTSDDNQSLGTGGLPAHSSNRQTRRSAAAISEQQQQSGSTTRNHQAALAEALGVMQGNHYHRKSPRYSIATSASTIRGPPSSSFFSPNNHHHQDNSHLLSTASSAHHNHHSVFASSGGGLATPRDQTLYHSHQTTSSTNFFSIIHSHFLTRCLHQETNKTSHLAAQAVFLASDPEASGLRTLVWVVENETSHQHTRHALAFEGDRPIPKRLVFFRILWNPSPHNSSTGAAVVVAAVVVVVVIDFTRLLIFVGLGHHNSNTMTHWIG